MTNKEAAYILSDKCDDYTVEELHTAFDLAIKALEERPQGEWISLANGSGINCGRKCSLCGKTVEFSENFCPQCGADMRGNDNG